MARGSISQVVFGPSFIGCDPGSGCNSEMAVIGVTLSYVFAPLSIGSQQRRDVRVIEEPQSGLMGKEDVPRPTRDR